VLGIWVNCRDDSCSLTLLYHANRQSYEVTFENVGPLYDEAWHKLAVHVTGVRTGRSVSASVYVDCALQGTKSLLEDYNFLLPFVNKKATSSQIWLGQRSRGYRGGFEKPWRVLYDLWRIYLLIFYHTIQRIYRVRNLRFVSKNDIFLLPGKSAKF
jgi:frataxin-like iron-binding protein CyaY